VFENGFRKLHLYMVCLSIGVISGYIVFVLFPLVLWLSAASLTSWYFVLPFTLWLAFMIAAVILGLTIKCQNCKKLLVVITNTNHINKNKSWVFWFLKDLPPTVLCEHCEAVYGNSPNK
jgi:hypothetical protein